MGEETKIEWCRHSWSPWRGCTKVSPGCANCYAETLSHRNPAVLGQWGKGKPRVLAKNWNKPVRWDRAREEESRREDRLVPKPTVFPSLCDWLDPEVDPKHLFEFLKLILRKTPNLCWLLLTKRPELFRERLRAAAAQCTVDPLDVTDLIYAWLDHERVPLNVWIGTSIEDQIRADERIPHLLRIPAVGRFLSVEPLLGPVDLRHMDADAAGHADLCQVNALTGRHTDMGRPCRDVAKVDWVIIGGESGPGARPCNIEWIRSLVGQCKTAGVPPFVKQLGADPVAFREDARPWRGLTSMKPFITHAKGGDPAEWPEDLRVREFPEGLR
jgi:protein gp37